MLKWSLIFIAFAIVFGLCLLKGIVPPVSEALFFIFTVLSAVTLVAATMTYPDEKENTEINPDEDQNINDEP